MNNHPNADKLHLVTVDIGSETKTVVCGAQNIEVGQIIPYASIGSKVFSRKTGEQFELVKTSIRGVESVGMLCSADELGLSDFNYQEEDGILILNRFLNNLTLGDDLAETLDIKEDVILHTAPTANRGDEMSVIGIAREISAIFNRKFNFSPLENQNEPKALNFNVEIMDEDICKYYAIGILKNVKIRPSPKWMQERLISAGVRPISNIVDITNYVMLEYGQPLHAFDFDKLDGYLCVRKAYENEKIVTLDSVERNLTEQSVVIATKEKPVCIAGVFGGENSEVDENTKNIALESAYFTPSTNRKSARSVGYRSEASARFERGIDLYSCKNALYRAISLLIEHADAKFEGIVEDKKYNDKLNQITLRFNEVKRILGCEIESGKCIQILDKLGFKLLGSNEIAAKFEVPGFRQDDVYREIDLIEEISRINGYDKIPATLPSNSNMIDVNPEQKYISKINNILLGSGFFEAKKFFLNRQIFT
ncbi:MAG: phenylalanine--tRNA ligase subunit beta [Candidatus Melainabacteria bacterium]|nr:MAG: phenylalanine--tRNA ligase subunit beta [Candidatus Melainabacteria bacterium]